MSSLQVDFVVVAQERTQLRRAGVRLLGRCPFDTEDTPHDRVDDASFTVNPVKKIYYCVGCQKAGDMFGFVRDTQGVSFVEAVEWLGQRFGIPLSYE